MNTQAIVAAAALAFLATAHAGPVAPKEGHEKCYGIAQAGQNDCANLAGTHACAGTATKSNDVGDWKYVPNGTCASMKGMSADEAKAKAAQAKKS